MSVQCAMVSKLVKASQEVICFPVKLSSHLDKTSMSKIPSEMEVTAQCYRVFTEFTLHTEWLICLHKVQIATCLES